MLLRGASFLLLFLCRALPLPLPTQLSKEDEKVIKCISEILADTLSSPSPIPVTSECTKILREDERVLAMLRHRHLLTELEELARQENAKHRLDHESDRTAWEEKQQGDIRKKDELARQKEAAPEKVEEHADERGGEEEEEEEEMKKYEKTKNKKEKIKVSRGEDLQETLEEQAEEEQQEEKEIKKRSSSETWSSKENFGHVKKRGPRQPKIRKGMLQGDEEGRKRNAVVKGRFRLDDTSNDEEEPRNYHHGGYSDHEKWEEEEKRSDMAKRVAEKASDEETAQFEEEEKEKGLKISNSKAHLHKGWKPWQEEAEEEENHSKMRHGHHRQSAGLDLRKRHWKDDVYANGRHHAPDEEDEDEEDKEASQSKAQELDKLEEIEREVKRAADKLEELKRG